MSAAQLGTMWSKPLTMLRPMIDVDASPVASPLPKRAKRDHRSDQSEFEIMKTEFLINLASPSLIDVHENRMTKILRYTRTLRLSCGSLSGYPLGSHMGDWAKYSPLHFVFRQLRAATDVPNERWLRQHPCSYKVEKQQIMMGVGEARTVDFTCVLPPTLADSERRGHYYVVTAISYLSEAKQCLSELTESESATCLNLPDIVKGFPLNMMPMLYAILATLRVECSHLQIWCARSVPKNLETPDSIHDAIQQTAGANLNSCKKIAMKGIVEHLFQ